MPSLQLQDGLDAFMGHRAPIYTIESGAVDILDDHGLALFSIRLSDRGIEVRAGVDCTYQGVVYSTHLNIRPVVSNCLMIERVPYHA